MKSHPSRRRQFLSAASMIAVIVTAGILFAFGSTVALLGTSVLALTAVLGIVWHSRSRAVRRLQAALDRYVETDVEARIDKIPGHAASTDRRSKHRGHHGTFNESHQPETA